MNLHRLSKTMALSGIAVPYEEQYNDGSPDIGNILQHRCRVEALINLGNLVTLQPSPYKNGKGQATR